MSKLPSQRAREANPAGNQPASKSLSRPIGRDRVVETYRSGRVWVVVDDLFTNVDRVDLALKVFEIFKRFCTKPIKLGEIGKGLFSFSELIEDVF